MTVRRQGLGAESRELTSHARPGETTLLIGCARSVFSQQLYSDQPACTRWQIIRQRCPARQRHSVRRSQFSTRVVLPSPLLQEAPGQGRKCKNIAEVLKCLLQQLAHLGYT